MSGFAVAGLPAGMTLRLARIEDLPQLVVIYNSTVASRQVTADLEPVSVASREPWFAAHQRADRPLWVLERAGVVEGWFSLSDFYGRAAYAASAEVSLYLAATCRGQGVGRCVLQALQQHAPLWGVRTLLGFVFAHNEPSVRLFEACGFARWGDLPRVARLDDTLADLLILGWEVSPA